MSKVLYYQHNIYIPKGNDIVIFRNQADGFRYAKDSSNEIYRLVNEGNGETFILPYKKISRIYNSTGEQMDIFITDKGTAVSFYSSTNTVKMVGAGFGGGGGGDTTINYNINPTAGGTSFAPLFDYYTDATTNAALETDLYSGTIAANILDTNGKKILAIYGGEGVVGGVTYTYRVYFGGTLIASAVTASNSDWQITVTLLRSGLTTGRVLVSFTNGATTQNNETDIAALDFTIPNILKITGQVGNAAGSITAKTGYVIYMPNA